MSKTQDQTPAPSRKLNLNSDGTVTIPLIGSPPRTVTLREPSMRELAELYDIVREADKSLPEMRGDTIDPSKMTAEQLLHFNEDLKARREHIYSATSPHGLALMKFVAMLSDETVDENALPGWVMSPSACQSVLDHFAAPLVG